MMMDGTVNASRNTVTYSSSARNSPGRSSSGRSAARRKSTRTYYLRRGLIALAVLALAVAAVFIILKLKRSSASFGTVTDMPFYSEAAYAFSGTGFYYVEGDALIYHDLSDSEKNASYSLSNALDVKLAGGNGSVVLYSGTSVQILGASEIIDAGGAVLSVSSGSQYVSVMRQDAEGKVAILVFDYAGTLVDTIEQSRALIVECGIRTLGGSDTLYTLELDTAGNSPVSILTTYTYMKDGAGVTQASMSGVINVTDQLADAAIFTAKSIFLSCTSELIRYDAALGTEVSRELVYGYRLKCASLGTDTTPLFAYERRTDSASRELKLYTLTEDASSKATARSVMLPEGAAGALAMRGKLCVFSGTTMLTYSASGEEGASYELGFTADAVYKLDETHALIDSGGAMKLITLK